MDQRVVYTHQSSNLFILSNLRLFIPWIPRIVLVVSGYALFLDFVSLLCLFAGWIFLFLDFFSFQKVKVCFEELSRFGFRLGCQLFFLNIFVTAFYFFLRYRYFERMFFGLREEAMLLIGFFGFGLRVSCWRVLLFLWHSLLFPPYTRII